MTLVNIVAARITLLQQIFPPLSLVEQVHRTSKMRTFFGSGLVSRRICSCLS